MNFLQAFLRDLGTYAAVMAAFAAIACYRANPLRAVNRYFSAFMATVAMWQLVVALARTTSHEIFWAYVAAIFGIPFAVLPFLLHDACVFPHGRLATRLRRNTLVWSSTGVFAVGSAFTYISKSHPGLYPYAYRLIAFVAFSAGIWELRKQRRFARAVNPTELLLFNAATACVIVGAASFELLPRPLSHQLNTDFALSVSSTIVAVLLSERVLDTAGTARVGFGYIIRFVVQFAILLPVFECYRAIGGTFRGQGMWITAIIVAFLCFPLPHLSEWMLRRVLQSFASKTETDARDAAIALVGASESEPSILHGVTNSAKAYLRGIDVHLDDSSHYDSASVLGFLVEATPASWLSPELAVRRFRGLELDRILDAFTDSHLGGVVKYIGRKATLVMFVGARAGGSKSITAHEMDFLYELLSIAGTGIDRIRAVDESLKSRTLALAGRVAADFSHSAKNQIAAIEAFVDALRSGEDAKLSPAHREAIHHEIQALATGQRIALEMSRVRKGAVTIATADVARVVGSVAMAYEGVIAKARGRFQIEPAGTIEEFPAKCDEAQLRQVLVNLVRNAIQAAVGFGREPVVTIRVTRSASSIHVDVVDNGPGVPAEVYDRLFTAWVTSKADGTGLGLAFCFETMRAMGGSVRYMTPRGIEHAWFRVDLPAAAAASDPPTLIAPQVSQT